MKKVFALLLVAGLFTFTSCDNKKSGETSANEEVIDTDTTDVSYDVEKTVVETDTTTKTEEVSTEDQDKNQNQNQGQ